MCWWCVGVNQNCGPRAEDGGHSSTAAARRSSDDRSIAHNFERRLGSRPPPRSNTHDHNTAEGIKKGQGRDLLWPGSIICRRCRRMNNKKKPSKDMKEDYESSSLPSRSLVGSALLLPFSCCVAAWARRTVPTKGRRRRKMNPTGEGRFLHYLLACLRLRQCALGAAGEIDRAFQDVGTLASSSGLWFDCLSALVLP